MLPKNSEVLGNGIVLFKDRIKVPDKLLDYLAQLKVEATEKHYSFVYDDNGAPLYATNKSGHRFQLEDIEKNCSRITDFYNNFSEDWQKDFFLECEQILYKTMIEYCSIYPMVLSCLWWKTQGHALAYGPGAGLGLHCDNDINFSPGFEPDYQLGIRHVLASITYFNSSVDKQDECNFVGGQINFPYAEVTYTPQVGDILMFPGNYMCTHEVFDVESGNRYAYLEYFGQGSSDPDRGVNIADPIEGVFGGQVWMPSLFDDYKKYVIEYYGENTDDHRLLPLGRQFNSSNTKEEVES